MYYDGHKEHGWAAAQRGNVLLRVMSPFQRIEFEQTNHGLSLYLNDEVQFTEKLERPYHDALAGTAIRQCPHASQVVILGGGDGLAARTIFERTPQANIALAELDPEMVRVCQQFNPIARMNRGALNRTQNLIGDAVETIRRIPSNSTDVVLCDFPDRQLGTLNLYDQALYGEIYRVLRPGGLVSSYAGGDAQHLYQTVRGQFNRVRHLQQPIDGLSYCDIIQGVKTCFN